MMSGIRGKNTKPELALRRALHRLGLRYRLHASGLPGKPDIVFPSHHAVVQIQGCFWHRHEGCSFATTPSSNVAFWNSKFSETVKRDARNLEALHQLGWRAAIVWECTINSEGADVVARQVAKWLASRMAFCEIPISAEKQVSKGLK
ncbi:very short patch repair endonuclease [Bradyrhizobium brasilense]|uniref:very short patch repair endonuclease n=1 Tax=Bradyrhizobium brasilense TaxID=1419277 RepID=UPI001FCDACDB|nr:very short patch repair endonuclease [Bradyrhizobium brasilense]